jgi:uncharacterized protein (TIGR02611 family)
MDDLRPPDQRSDDVPLRQPHEDHESFRQPLRDAAIEAERQTGAHELTEEEARRSLSIRMLRIVAGFLVMLIGIAALPLPGPGWLIIIVGLNLLPFAWAERTIRLIRRKVPGVPEEGNVPVHTWVIMGVLTVSVTTISILWGDDISDWVRDLI